MLSELLNRPIGSTTTPTAAAADPLPENRMLGLHSPYVESMRASGKIVGFDQVVHQSSDPFRFGLRLDRIQTNPDPASGQSPQTIDGRRSVVRTDTGYPLGVVSDGYGIVQPSVTADTIDAICEATGGKLARTRVLGNGATLSARIILPGETAENTKRPTINLRAVDFLTSNDGTGAYQFSASVFRLSCRNAYHAFVNASSGRGRDLPGNAHRRLARVSIKHTRSAPTRAAIAEVLQQLEPAYTQFETDFARLMARPTTSAERYEYYGRIIVKPIVTTDHTGDELKRLLKQAEKARAAHDAMEDNVRSYETETAWGALNAATRWAQHNRGVRGESENPENRIYANLPGGSGFDLSVEAQTAALELWG